MFFSCSGLARAWQRWRSIDGISDYRIKVSSMHHFPWHSICEIFRSNNRTVTIFYIMARERKRGERERERERNLGGTPRAGWRSTIFKRAGWRVHRAEVPLTVRMYLEEGELDDLSNNSQKPLWTKSCATISTKNLLAVCDNRSEVRRID